MGVMYAARAAGAVASPSATATAKHHPNLSRILLTILFPKKLTQPFQREIHAETRSYPATTAPRGVEQLTD
jgi:hypothetical protein